MHPLSLNTFKGEFFKIIHTTDKSQVGVMTLSAGQDSGPEERHEGDQVVYIIEGAVEIEVNREPRKLSAGMVVTIPANAQHHIYNRSSRAAFLLSVYAPPSY